MTDRSDNDPFSGIQPYEELAGLTGSEPLPSLEDPRTPPAIAPRSPLLTGLVLGLLLVVVSIALFQLLGNDSDDPVVAGSEEASSATAETSDGATESSTAAPTDDTGDTSGTDAGTGGDPGIVAAPYLPVGAPIAIEDLTLAVDGVGDIKFGEPAADALGRLVSSLGDPDSDTGPQLSVGEWGVCEGDTERVAAWGPFAAIVVVDPDGTETFAGYRLDFAFGGFSSEAANLQTLSGLQAGASYRQLEQVYDGFDIRQVEDPDKGALWELYSTNTGALLLWGPLTTDDTVQGIYAPDACGRF